MRWSALFLLLSTACAPNDYVEVCEDVEDRLDDQVGCLETASSQARQDVQEAGDETRDCASSDCESGYRDAVDEATRRIDKERGDAERDMREDDDARSRRKRLLRALRELGWTLEDLRKLLERLRDRDQDRQTGTETERTRGTRIGSARANGRTVEIGSVPTTTPTPNAAEREGKARWSGCRADPPRGWATRRLPPKLPQGAPGAQRPRRQERRIAVGL